MLAIINEQLLALQQGDEDGSCVHDVMLEGLHIFF